MIPVRGGGRSRCCLHAMIHSLPTKYAAGHVSYGVTCDQFPMLCAVWYFFGILPMQYSNACFFLLTHGFNPMLCPLEYFFGMLSSEDA